MLGVERLFSLFGRSVANEAPVVDNSRAAREAFFASVDKLTKPVQQIIDTFGQKEADREIVFSQRNNSKQAFLTFYERDLTTQILQPLAVMSLKPVEDGVEIGPRSSIEESNFYYEDAALDVAGQWIEGQMCDFCGIEDSLEFLSGVQHQGPSPNLS